MNREHLYGALCLCLTLTKKRHECRINLGVCTCEGYVSYTRKFINI